MRKLSAQQMLQAALIVIALVLAAVLTVLALAHVRPEHVATPASTAPVDDQATESSAPANEPTGTPPNESPAPTGELVTFTPAEERFLTHDEGALWRGVAGTCGVTAPVIERSVDGGVTWEDVTPVDLAEGQLLALQPFMQTEAQIVALVGAECKLQAMRTFTQGVAWRSYPDVLVSSTYVDPVTPGQVVLQGESRQAPCEAPHGLRELNGSAVLLCEGVAYQLSADSDWQPLSASNVVSAAIIDENTTAAAHLTAECEGIMVAPDASTTEPSTNPAHCIAASEEAAVALTASAESFYVWAGDEWFSIARD